MNIKIKCFFLILAVFIFSCKNEDKKNDLLNSGNDEIVNEEKKVNKEEVSKLDNDKIIEQVQGKWKEIAYPYRTVEFVNSTVKFIEEGIPMKPEFEKFEVSQNCQFDNSNIKDLKSTDVILILPKKKICEKLTISKDTLILSGYSTNSSQEYEIIYLKK